MQPWNMERVGAQISWEWMCEKAHICREGVGQESFESFFASSYPGEGPGNWRFLAFFVVPTEVCVAGFCAIGFLATFPEWPICLLCAGV